MKQLNIILSILKLPIGIFIIYNIDKMSSPVTFGGATFQMYFYNLLTSVAFYVTVDALKSFTERK
jgi:hypothetical protein